MNSFSRFKTLSCVIAGILCCAIFCATVSAADKTVSAAADKTVSANVIKGTPGDTVVNFAFGDYETDTVSINGREYLSFDMNRQHLLYEEGSPALPHVAKSVIIPNQGSVRIETISSSYHDFENVVVAPSKGHISRQIDPASVPYTFGDVYEKNAFYPAEIATLSDPYIMRDVRGVVVHIHPVQYNPVTKVLRVHQEVNIRVAKDVSSTIAMNTLPLDYSKPSQSFNQIAATHFINGGGGNRYPGLNEQGEMLIIVYDNWNSNVQSLKTWKDSIGIPTTVVNKTTAGSTSSAIQSYIQNFYNNNNLAFVLLVGDASQVPTPSSGGYAADPTYSLLAGSDHYPDILVGRFSAGTSAHVDTQVTRTIEFEQMIHQGSWNQKGTGIASTEGPGHHGEYDDDHMDLIRDKLLSYTYTAVDRFYGYGATSTQVTNAVNSGRGMINYCGHGSQTSWSTTGFSNSNVNALTNDNLLPFITSVACVNGQFNTTTCFAETWLRATHNGEPSGAVAMYASSQYQSWAPPMDGQDEIIDRYIDETYVTFGALCFAGASYMMQLNGATGREEFDHWHVFGDPSLNTHGQGGGPTDPVVDIEINDQDGPMTVFSSQTINMTVTVQPNQMQGIEMDWWVYGVKDSVNKYWWRYPGTWIFSSTPRRAYDGALVAVTDYLIASAKIPSGNWVFYFAVDAKDNTYQGTYIDDIEVTSL